MSDEDPNVFDDLLDCPTCERCGIYPAATCECDEEVEDDEEV